MPPIAVPGARQGAVGSVNAPAARRAHRDRRWWPVLAATVAMIGALCTPASASPMQVPVPEVPSAPAPKVVAATTNLTLFIGSGVVTAYLIDPGPVTSYASSWAQFSATVADPSADLANAVRAFFQNGGIGAWILVTADDTPATLSRTLDAWKGPPSPQLVNLVTVPALGGFDGAAYDRVATSLGALAVRTSSFAILEPPRALVAEVIAADDVGPLVAFATHLRATLPAAQQIRSALYVTSLPGNLYDPYAANAPEMPVSAILAGIFAATDITRGVWKAPAGVNTDVAGATTSPFVPTSAQTGQLNIEGVDPLMSMPPYGLVVWGARTLAGTDVADSAWKYASVRRLADFIENSLQQSMRWAVFEPNTAALWASLKLEATTFMSGLYAQGAFTGVTAAQAYTVEADATTTTPDDQRNGVVNIEVSFAPVDPAEVVVLTITLDAAASS